MASAREQDRDEKREAEAGPLSREGYLLWLDPTTPSQPTLRGEVERARTADRRRFASDEGLLRTLRALAGGEAPEPSDRARAPLASTPDAPTTPTTQEDER